jgi:hypothetical protein
MKKGWKQRKHIRRSKKGKAFKAGSKSKYKFKNKQTVIEFLDACVNSENELKDNIEGSYWELEDKDFKLLQKLINIDMDEWDWKGIPSSSYARKVEQNDDYSYELDSGGDSIKAITYNEDKAKKLLERLKNEAS